MQTNKEALLALLRGEKADFIPEVYGTMKDVVFPGERFIELGPNFDPYGTGPDAWGVLWTNQGPNPMIDGNMVAKDFRLFDDMEHWKDHVKFPPLDFMPLAEIFGGMCAGMHVNPETDVVSCLLLSGQFERLNQMIGMEDALCAFYEYPDEMKEFLEAMCQYKLKCIDKAVEHLHPDVIHMHDDWGTNSNMFFSPEIWREYIKPLEARYVKRIQDYMVIVGDHELSISHPRKKDFLRALDDPYIPHAPMFRALEALGLNAQGMTAVILQHCAEKKGAGSSEKTT